LCCLDSVWIRCFNQVQSEENNLVMGRGDHFRFGSVFIKKSNQTEFFFEKKNRTETGSNRPVSVRFGFFRAKTGSNRFGSVFPVLARFFRFGSVFLVWLGFSGLARFWLGFLSVSVRFGFFGFLFIKPKPNRTGRFFQKINRFNRFFFRLFFFRFSRFNRFSGFFSHP